MSKAAICESHLESKFMVHDSAHSLSNALGADFERRQKREYYKTLLRVAPHSLNLALITTHVRIMV